MDVRVGLWRKLSAEELMLLNCGDGEDSWESRLLDCKEIQPVHPRGDQSWVFIGRTDAEAETPILWAPDVRSWLIWKLSPWCWEGLGAGGEGDDKGWDGGMVLPTQRTWIWVNSGSWCWTGRPGILQSMGLQSWTLLGNWTELNWSEPANYFYYIYLVSVWDYFPSLVFPLPLCLHLVAVPFSPLAAPGEIIKYSQNLLSGHIWLGLKYIVIKILLWLFSGVVKLGAWKRNQLPDDTNLQMWASQPLWTCVPTMRRNKTDIL